jgi:hypothetical protein
MIAGMYRISGEVFASQLKTLVLSTPSCFRKCPLDSLQALGVFTVPCTGVRVRDRQVPGSFSRHPPGRRQRWMERMAIILVQVEWQGDVSDQLLFD